MKSSKRVKLLVICFLEIIQHCKQQNIHIFFTNSSKMGACLLVETRKNYDKNGQATQPIQVRAVIEQQLKEGRISDKPSTVQQTPSPRSGSRKVMFFTTPVDQNQLSIKVERTSKKSVIKSGQSSHCLKKSRKDTIVSLEQFTNRLIHEAKPRQQNQNLGQQQQLQQQQLENQDFLENIQPQTPYSRLFEPANNQIEKGLTQEDQLLIQSTLKRQTPVRMKEIKLKNHSVYLGQWLNGMRHGQGFLRWADGSTYSGKWVNNCSQGLGQLCYADSTVYEGQFVENKAEGKGVCRYADGSQYQGQWVNNEREGKGVLTWRDGDRYEGQWLGGKKHGYGELFFQGGSYYKGEFHSNELHGRGIYCWLNLKTYDGEWEHNQMNGQGKLTWKSGEVYEGTFMGNKYEGLGVLIFPDGSSSSGIWERGRRQGQFQDRDSAGRVVLVDYYLGKKLKPMEQCHSKDKLIPVTESKTTQQY